MDKKNSKGQVGETLTWIVATIIILVIIIFFIFGSSLLGGTKSVTTSFRQSITSSQKQEPTDFFLQKSLFTYVSSGPGSSQLQLDNALEKMAAGGNFSLDYNATKKQFMLDYGLR